MRLDSKHGTIIIAAAAAAALAWPPTSRAQPTAPPGDGAGSASGTDAAPPGDAEPIAPVAPEPPPERPPPLAAPSPSPPPPPAPRHPDVLPQILVAPSARLLPAGVIYWRSGIDTSGGLSSDARVGLGDVAEFGVALTDLIRRRNLPGDAPERINGYVNAIFKMGVAEDRLFAGQPALSLGFRKSFERAPDANKTRVAELYLVATQRLGARTSLHLGGVFWDASVQHDDDAPSALHDRGVGEQLRPFGGLELSPLDDAQILIDVYWTPEFCFGCADDTRIRLKPLLSWGVRYTVADWIQIESGVRVPDIGDANLLDAQIFGQLVFVDWHLHPAVSGR